MRTNVAVSTGGIAHSLVFALLLPGLARQVVGMTVGDSSLLPVVAAALIRSEWRAAWFAALSQSRSTSLAPRTTPGMYASPAPGGWALVGRRARLSTQVRGTQPRS